MTEALIQGSDEWLAARCGKVTASRIWDLIARTKTGPSASRANYLAQLIAEVQPDLVILEVAERNLIWAPPAR